MPSTADQSASSALFHVGAVVLESRRQLAALALGGALVALLSVVIIGPRYSATASFQPQAGGDSDLSALMGIAGQFGLPIRGGTAAPPPELYAALVSSASILDPIADESFPRDFAEGAAPASLAELYRVRTQDRTRRHELVIEELQERVSASVNRRTGIIGLRVRTRWPAVSKSIAERILEELNTFNLEKRQSQAKAERVFAEERAVEARAALASAEDAARDFALRNRVVAESPALRLEQERHARVVSLRQQVLTSMEQQLESARLREVQDTPVITVFQPPTVLSVPDPRGRVKWTILGAIFGLLVAAIVLPVRALVEQSRGAPSAEARRFSAAWDATKRQLQGPFARAAKD